ncbi:NTP transferase domain-containing protein [Heliobacterium gestii]|uniref:NTP transferase domain-containing protein n=1 Tax=Heliomicrobium gestii TaxID=2699 RepID=A0A845LEE2_HELGE|nr:glycosyltransferase family protein [Heliomicrobium gestii]MBM7866721.1 spore coat polysaccharide biosynthesis protein SpsF [Heliomicrobium gestii]MZP42999.1 NTP transferase domain-containing protein [Heliomicrobium gestii]
MTRAIIVQARMGSSRLPGKVLMPLAGMPLLWHVLERLKRVREADVLCLATSRGRIDDPVADLARSAGAYVFRGDEADVLSRYALCAREVDAATVVRITADCPLIDPDIVAAVMTTYAEAETDYMTVDQCPRGLDTEVFSREALEQAFAEALYPAAREHVTFHLYHSGRFDVQRHLAPEAYRRPQYRLCVDERKDFQLMEEIYRRFYRPGGIAPVPAVLRWLDEHPEWGGLNSDVLQKAVDVTDAP